VGEEIYALLKLLFEFAMFFAFGRVGLGVAIDVFAELVEMLLLLVHLVEQVSNLFVFAEELLLKQFHLFFLLMIFVFK
jgi:hypothetical protein